jgi:hypothetical protein
MKRFGLVTLLVALVMLSGCALFNPALKDQAKTNPIGDVINIGDGKILGLDLKAEFNKVLDLLPSCNADHKLTPNCLIAAADGVMCTRTTITPETTAIKEALAQLGFIGDEQEYKCCKGVAIAGKTLFNMFDSGNIGTILGLVKK